MTQSTVRTTATEVVAIGKGDLSLVGNALVQIEERQATVIGKISECCNRINNMASDLSGDAPETDSESPEEQISGRIGVVGKSCHNLEYIVDQLEAAVVRLGA